MILVTGGTGLLGGHLLYNLVCKNEHVRAIYRTKKTLKNVKSIFLTYTEDYESLLKKIEWVKADILDIPALDKALKNVSYVYHCAAFVSFEPHKYYSLRRTNIEGTANVVNLCLSNNIKKLCYVSSIAALGSPVKTNVITEETTWNPEDDNSVYAITKYGAEIEVWRGTQEGLDVVIVNPGVILGAGIWNYGSGSIFKKIDKGLNFFTSGSIGLISVQDVVKVMVTLLKSEIKNERFILVSKNWSYKTFLQYTAKALHAKIPKKEAKPWLLNIAWRLDWIKHIFTRKRRVLTKHLVKSLTTKHTYNNSKIVSELNYKFTPIEHVINEIASLYRK